MGGGFVGRGVLVAGGRSVLVGDGRGVLVGRTVLVAWGMVLVGRPTMLVARLAVFVGDAGTENAGLVAPNTVLP